jgi:hypothetical protein
LHAFYSGKRNCEINGNYVMDNRELSKNENVKVRIQILNQWFSIVNGRDVRVSGPMLKSKSKELAKKLGHNDLNATDGWLSRCKWRFGIKFKKAHG